MLLSFSLNQIQNRVSSNLRFVYQMPADLLEMWHSYSSAYFSQEYYRGKGIAVLPILTLLKSDGMWVKNALALISKNMGYGVFRKNIHLDKI